ncbi:PDZ domain-containing protein [Chitinophaga lutea]|uniref:PDZ domain-containing protein n=1 Tax=Chitinophaga lutea TaxID=2488634 RepID=A0A3N4Q2R3_9BACT|nr:PDZ domain-containing protein [Chitinophaga lutea]RPE13865.1 PDZ domain-containing protein [Chitinophaga lutea]
MRRILYILSMGALTTTLALPAAAQEKRSGKLGEYDEIIIKRKGGSEDAKVTIEIKDGEVLADGKKLDEYKNGDVIIQRRRIVPRNGNMGGMPFIFDEDGRDEEQTITLGGNKAVLGVITEKKEAAGATVVEVADGSAAEKAGLKEGDVITAIDDKKISEPQDLYETIGGMKPGDKITVTYKRGGKEAKANTTLNKREESAPRVFSIPQRPGQPFRFREDMPSFRGFSPEGRSGPRLGLSVQDTEEGNGAKVLGVSKGSPAEKAGFQENDLITELDGNTVKNAGEVADAYRAQKEGSTINAKVLRNGKSATLTIKVPKKLNTENL